MKKFAYARFIPPSPNIHHPWLVESIGTEPMHAEVDCDFAIASTEITHQRAHSKEPMTHIVILLMHSSHRVMAMLGQGASKS